jgi:hypothetical protein
MYSKQEASQLRQQFWTAFGQYMSPILSLEGLHINWINYKTGERDIYFKMDAGAKVASVAIEIRSKDAGLQALYFEQFQQLQTILHNLLEEEWTWLLHTTDEYGNLLSRIYTELEGVSIFKKEDWPQLISFFKPRIIALDEFWSNAKYAFEALR